MDGREGGVGDVNKEKRHNLGHIKMNFYYLILSELECKKQCDSDSDSGRNQGAELCGGVVWRDT